MLQHLQIKDLVIVRALALDFQDRLTALTGETGAGKSILVDALGLALGDQADKGMIRNGCETAEISASFDLPDRSAAQDWLVEHGLASDGECILRRVLVRSGRSRSYINGKPVPLQQLRELGSVLIDIHGQHEHQSLLKTASQRRLLDIYGGHVRVLEQVADRYRQYQQAKQQLQELRVQADDRNQRLDYINFQLDELQQLGLGSGELEELAGEQRKLANAEQLAEESALLTGLLFETDNSAQAQLSRACVMVQQLAELDPQLKDSVELLESSRIQLEEANRQIRDYASSVSVDPQRLAEVDSRLAHIHDLARKHRLPPERLPDQLESLQEERRQLENADNLLQGLEQEVESLVKQYLEQAAQLSASREQAATRLADEITASMQGLGMTGGMFKIDHMQLPMEEATRYGRDKVEFLVSTNPGQAFAPLSKVASGGELSRISLAIQVATAGCGEVPVLIFDEVDSGIGGAVAEIVGKLLRELGGQRQVLCVTHLPQVAAQAHQQLLVSKQTDGKSTETTLSPLDDEAREQEIARMLGGVKITRQTLGHAREMIHTARTA